MLDVEEKVHREVDAIVESDVEGQVVKSSECPKEISSRRDVCWMLK